MSGIGPSPLMNLIEHLCGPQTTVYLMVDAPALFRELLALMHGDRTRNLEALLPHFEEDFGAALPCALFWSADFQALLAIIQPAVYECQGHKFYFLCRRLGQCSEAILDFRGVETIGPGFADEVFRVFHQARPETSLITLHANAEVRRRIREALDASSAPSAPPPAATTKEERPARS